MGKTQLQHRENLHSLEEFHVITYLAINIKLKESAKSRLVGTLKAGGGMEQKKGEKFGKDEGKHEAYTETAQRLLAMGLSAEEVAKATQLPLEIIKKLSDL